MDPLMVARRLREMIYLGLGDLYPGGDSKITPRRVCLLLNCEFDRHVILSRYSDIR